MPGTQPNSTELLRLLRDDGRPTVLRVLGDIDMTTADTFSEGLRATARSAVPPGPVIADLNAVEFLGAAGLVVLVQEQAWCDEHGITLRIVSSARPVLRSIKVTGLDATLTVSRTVDEALTHA
ncbi:anti-sigma factor antagonist [Amycolatopsis pithecellobii]|uniref:anti-sigma factor antagonist n=1 Tax=Amycolatopsis pithecellobii TaxID=664692 RepID=UPI00140D95A9|nr:anti-sigma factor antagonist [Amycolatopsis pithecellobii]